MRLKILLNEEKQHVTLGDDGISLRTSERRPHTIIR